MPTVVMSILIRIIIFTHHDTRSNYTEISFRGLKPDLNAETTRTFLQELVCREIDLNYTDF